MLLMHFCSYYTSSPRRHNQIVLLDIKKSCDDEYTCHHIQAMPPEKCTFLLKTPSGGKNDNRAFKLFSQVTKITLGYFVANSAAPRCGQKVGFRLFLDLIQSIE